MKNNINLHITHDDKFLDFFIENEEKFKKTQNRYIVYSNDDFIKFSNNLRIEVVESNVESIIKKIENINHYRYLYIHFLSDLMIDFLIKYDIKIPVIWIFWGADGFLYNHYFSKKCLLPKTKKIKHLQKNINNKISLNKKLNIILEERKLFKFKQMNYLKASKKITYFAYYLYKDFLLIKKHTQFNASYIDFNYISLDQFKLNTQDKIYQNNIIIGNSASIFNNHLDIFYKIKKRDNKINKIYCPLSYEANKKYIDFISKKGKELFKEKFFDMTNFLTKKKYYEILSNISFAFFNTIRSQAAGNILALLYSGCSVFLKKQNPLFSFFKDKNLIIFEIDKDLRKKIKKDLLIYLSKEERNHNKKIIENLFNNKEIEKKYNNLLTISQITP